MEEVGQTPMRMVQEKARPYVCPQCRNQFRTSSDLRRHQRIHSEVKLIHCSFENCSFSTHRRDSLKLHEKTHTGIESRLVHPCPSCSKTFSSEQIAIRHRKTCGRIKEGARDLVTRDTKCHFCGKEFSSVYKLATHIKLHNGTLEFECEQCGKGLPSKAALNKHRMSHQKSFQCELCQKLFSRKDNLQAHFQTHFKSERASKGGSNLVVEYICSFCHRTVCSREELMEHFETDPVCSKHCHEHLARENDVVREEIVEYDQDAGEENVDGEEGLTGEDGEHILVEETEHTDGTEVILVDHEIRDQEILIIEEPVFYC